MAVPAEYWCPLILSTIEAGVGEEGIAEIVRKIQEDARQDTLLAIERYIVDQFK